MTTEARSSTRMGPGVAAGVTEEMIQQVVHAFYATVRTDPAIGPIFNRIITEAPNASPPRQAL